VSGAAGDRPPRILLVEDNETIRQAFTILLEESGYEVLQAGTGRAALDSALADAPDLALMDLGLPDMNGLEVTRRLKADERTRHIVVVALTGHTLESEQRACIEAGCSAFLAKPIDTQMLLRQLPEFLGEEGRGEREE
jgi:two-component system, cell cycle response regulator DivK